MRIRDLVGQVLGVGASEYRVIEAELSAHPQVTNLCEVKLTLVKLDPESPTKPEMPIPEME